MFRPDAQPVSRLSTGCPVRLINRTPARAQSLKQRTWKYGHSKRFPKWRLVSRTTVRTSSSRTYRHNLPARWKAHKKRDCKTLFRAANSEPPKRAREPRQGIPSLREERPVFGQAVGFTRCWNQRCVSSPSQAGEEGNVVSADLGSSVAVFKFFYVQIM